MINIGILPQARWRYLKKLRLEALQNENIAFGSSFEEEQEFSEKEWKKRINNIIFALSNNEPIGLISYIFNNKIKSKHIAYLFGLYVKSEYRGKGIGKKLLESALNKIMENRNIKKINLSVNSQLNVPITLYKKFGFIEVGKLKFEFNIKEKYYNEIIMEKYL